MITGMEGNHPFNLNRALETVRSFDLTEDVWNELVLASARKAEPEDILRTVTLFFSYDVAEDRVARGQKPFKDIAPTGLTLFGWDEELEKPMDELVWALRDIRVGDTYDFTTLKGNKHFRHAMKHLNDIFKSRMSKSLVNYSEIFLSGSLIKHNEHVMFTDFRFEDFSPKAIFDYAEKWLLVELIEGVGNAIQGWSIRTCYEAMSRYLLNHIYGGGSTDHYIFDQLEENDESYLDMIKATHYDCEQPDQLVSRLNDALYASHPYFEKDMQQFTKRCLKQLERNQNDGH